MNLSRRLWLLAGCLVATTGLALEKPYPGPFVESEDFLFVLIPRTPEQMAAFYEARGFPPAAIAKIKATCFITVHIENHSQRVIWMEPHNWKYHSEGQPLQRLNSDYWATQWDAIDLPQASRSTFGWTQLPAKRDLQPHEPVGGNLVFPGKTGRFELAAVLETGQDRRGTPIEVRFENIECSTGEPAE
ncbi:MAG TPA: hypothetical protein VET88_11640 [Gammaproteobacteria bacterium]|nr:hypothetical protein [Gammaproteobacteria bacterium]